MSAKVEFLQGYGCDSPNNTVERLTKLQLIVSIPYRNGYLVARYGVNKKTLKNYSKRLDGTK